jgi:2-keto-4-pentenoate hydratase/2-oxohepta-3-ene-1,7-dioic acid hydratase in catechol pathway
MKLCRYDDDRLGLVIGDKVHDVTAAQTEIRAAASYTMKGDAVIAAVPAWRARIEAMAAKAPGKPVSQVRLLAPVARPTKVMAAPTNYAAHIAEAVADPGIRHIDRPTDIGKGGIFLKANSSMAGPSEGVPIRFLDRRNDHEIELVLIIGKQGSDIPRERALEHVMGYCLGLDMTVRGPEDRSFRKSIDGYTVLGPWIVTADEVPDPASVPLSLRVNGELRQSPNTSDLIYDIPRLIEFASSFYTLYPGDIFFTGTDQGVGPVKPGDVISAECPFIGAMEVRVRAHVGAGL